MRKWGSMLTAMVTPFTAAGELDLATAKKVARHLVEHGSDGVVVAGTTGESPTLSVSEKRALWQTVLEEIGDTHTVLAGSGSNDTASSVRLTKEAEADGVHGAMLVAPYYNKPSQEGLYQHFAAIADGTSLPVLLYNVPGRTQSNIASETTLRLAHDLQNVVAIKEASGQIDQITEILAARPKDFLVYSGDDTLTLPLLAIGADGVISVAAHVVGKQIRHMMDAYRLGQIKQAAAIHQRYQPLFKGMFLAPSPAPVKFALNKMGLNTGPMRLPMVPLSQREESKILAMLNDLNMAAQ